MNRFFRDKCFYFFMAATLAVAVPVMADDTPDSTDGEQVVVVPVAAPQAPAPKKVSATKKKADKQEEPAADDAAAAPNPNKGGYGYANFGGGGSYSDVNKSGMGHASVGYVAPDGGRVDAKIMGESGEYASFKLSVDGLGYRFVCTNPSDKFCFKLGADLDARYGIGSKAGEIGGAILPTLQLRFVADNGTEYGFGAGMAAGGIYTARLVDATGSNMGEGGVGPQVEFFINQKWIKGRIAAKNIFQLAPGAVVKNYFDARAQVFVPFGTAVPVGWYGDFGAKVITEDTTKSAPALVKGDVQHVDFTGTTGFQFVF
jgi:hypothetical protein